MFVSRRRYVLEPLHVCPGSRRDTRAQSGTHSSVSKTGTRQSPWGFDPPHRAIRYGTPADTHTVHAGGWHASALALLEASPVRWWMAQGGLLRDVDVSEHLTYHTSASLCQCHVA